MNGIVELIISCQSLNITESVPDKKIKQFLHSGEYKTWPFNQLKRRLFRYVHHQST